jgi:hypothetical protein
MFVVVIMMQSEKIIMTRQKLVDNPNPRATTIRNDAYDKEPMKAIANDAEDTDAEGAGLEFAAKPMQIYLTQVDSDTADKESPVGPRVSRKTIFG